MYNFAHMVIICECRGDWGMSYKYEDIKHKNSEELSAMLASQIEKDGGYVSINFLADEIKRKENKEFSIKMNMYTKWIAIMTAVMLIATLVNVWR